MATATIFQRGYLWAKDQGETDISLFGGGDFNQGLKYADEMGWSFCIKVQDGQQERNIGLADLIRQRRAALGLRNHPILGWSTNRDQPKDDAEKTNGLIAREGLKGFISECETYKGLPLSEPHNRLKIFMDRALQIEPLRTIMQVNGGWGFCYLPNEPAGPYLDWDQVPRGMGRGVPECYPNEFPDAPSQQPFPAIALGVSGYSKFPRSYMHPVVGMHAGVQQWRMSGYIDSLLQSKRAGYFTYGFGVYGIENLNATDRKMMAERTKPAGTTGPEVLCWY